MCGIAGFLGTYPREVAMRMGEAIAHRGPDDDGLFFDAAAGIGLAHRRLSIIDLSPLGHQPMADRGGRFQLVYNGEIYNYRELRRELVARGATFRGDSDSEVLLELLARDGPGALARLNGIFAFALWDRERGVLTLGRDGLGVKPLYLARGPGGIGFASEIKALLALPDLDRTIDQVAAGAYLTYLWSPGERTMFAAVKKLPPGHWLAIGRDGREAGGCFYRLPDPRPQIFAGRQAVEGLHDHLAEAVRRQMVADVEVGAFLSGGLDSSAIVHFARGHSASRLRCFTARYEQVSGGEMVADLPYARQVARHLDVGLEEVSIDDRIVDDLPGLIWSLDEPQADPAALLSLHIARLARRSGIKVLLSGTGGDDILTGYRRHLAARAEPIVERIPRPARKLLALVGRSLPSNPTVARRLGKWLAMLDRDAARRIAGAFEWIDADRAGAMLRAHPSGAEIRAPLLDTLAELPSDDPVERTLRLDQRFFLADHNLNYGDKTGMAAGVEVRVPFLDPDLIAFAASLGPDAKVNRGMTKWALRKAMAPHLPAAIIDRPKTGFGVPLRQWLRGRMRPMMEELLDPKRIASRGLLDPVAVGRLKSDTLSGRRDGSYSLLAAMAIELWARRFVDQPAPAPVRRA